MDFWGNLYHCKDARLEQTDTRARMGLDQHEDSRYAPYSSSITAAFSNPLTAQELVEFENGQVADADDLNQSLNFLLAEIELKSSSERARTTSTAAGSDGDGIPNNATFDAEELASLFLSSRPISVSGDKIIVSSGGALKNERLWEFALPEGFNLEAYSKLSMTIDVQMEKANGVDSDFAVGITDETKIMVFVNNDASNDISQIFDGNILVSEGVISHDENSGYLFSITGTERDNYRVGVTLDANSTVVDVIDLGSVYPDQQGVFPEQLLQAGQSYKITIHANEVTETYVIKSVSVNFPSELVDPD